MLFREPGAELVRKHLSSARISSVNYCEVLTQAQKLTSSHDDAKRYVERQNLLVIPFDSEQATLAAKLSPLTQPYGLSLADRACLSLALREGGTVLTADRVWAELDLGLQITLIR